MRTNLPVTQREYPFPPGQTLVSTTDPQGRILYCNETFIEVSGYTREELLGQPHNLIRHPDMPEEAFRDMWATIQSGRPWSAPVKNRRKNGDHYWVMANATPLMEDGRPVGYMSVRTQASREQIDAAEALYATMRAEKAQGQRLHVFKEGRLVRATTLGRLQEALRLGLGAKLLITLLAMVLVAQLINLLLPTDTPLFTTLNIGAKAVILWGIWRYLVQLITGPLGHLIDAANRLAACDLTHDVPRTRHDELGDLEAALNQLAVNLRSVVGDARRQSDEVVQGVSEIAQGNLDLSQRTEAQASNLQQTAASMEEITGTVRQSADSAHRASTLMAGTHTTAERGKTAVNEVGQTMGAIQQASGRISEITQVIDSIAFQTNILALNAAVEAARAGELGKGFAVVAGEVRALAQRTSSAAKEIKQLIEESASTVAQGQGKTQAAQTTLADTVTGVSQMRTLVDEISHASGEQLNGISQINAAVAQLDTITQQNAALVEQVASSAQSVERLARATAATVAVFRLQDQRKPVPEQAVALRRQMKGQPAALALSH